jgi:iron(III) transport system permease protein
VARRARAWLSASAGVVAALLTVPVAVVALSWFTPDSGAWQHIVSTTLPDLLASSAWLVVLVGLGAAGIGTLSAWIVARHDWRGRATFEWLLVLPLAMPAYVMAYAYTDLLQYAGPVQTSLREWFGWQSKSDYWFFEIRSVGGAATMLAFVLYPYVYLLARVAFLEQSSTLTDAARSFGYGRWALFWRVSLPLARPAIVAGTALVLMETLADYGTVSYFGVNTFTTGIFSAWFAQGDRIAAAKLATLLLAFVLVVLALEHRARRQGRFADQTNARRAALRERLSGSAAIAATLVCTIPVLIGFALPLLILAGLMWRDADAVLAQATVRDFVELAWNSFSLATLTAGLAVALGLMLVYAVRLSANPLTRGATRIAGMGYAIPGTIIAVGVLLPVTLVDHALADAVSAALGRDVGLILTGGFGVLIYAYLIRFLSIAVQSTEAGFAKITPNMDSAARSLGASNREIIVRVHAPLLRSSLITAALLVFVDVMKELPATLVMRPFNFDTLAVRAYTFAKDERLAEASVAAIAIVLVGLLPVVFASRAITKERPSGAR